MDPFYLSNSQRVPEVYKALLIYYNPVGPLEKYLVKQIARLMFDIREQRNMRASVFKEALYKPQKSVVALQRAATPVERSAHAKRRELELEGFVALTGDQENAGVLISQVVEHVDLRKILLIDKHEAHLGRELDRSIKQLAFVQKAHAA